MLDPSWIVPARSTLGRSRECGVEGCSSIGAVPRACVCMLGEWGCDRLHGNVSVDAAAGIYLWTLRGCGYDGAEGNAGIDGTTHFGIQLVFDRGRSRKLCAGHPGSDVNMLFLHQAGRGKYLLFLYVGIPSFDTFT